MIYIVYSETDEPSVKYRLGKSEYSYYFVRNYFLPVLEKSGIVVSITDPANEVDWIYQFCRAVDIPCIFFSFAPPHRTTVDLECPTIPVFAWEFSTIPDESWNDDERNNWARVLETLGCAIVHSSYTVKVIKSALGKDYPVVSLPAPVWNRSGALNKSKDQTANESPDKTFTLKLRERYLDSNELGSLPQNDGRLGQDLVGSIEFSVDLGAFSSTSSYPIEDRGRSEVAVQGIVYTSVLNPHDIRKNIADTIIGFCWAHRSKPDAVLILKLVTSSPNSVLDDISNQLSELSPFDCRVIVISEYMDTDDYKDLVNNSTYVVNTSLGEGQCLPLMEFMSAGVPAVTPDHTAMADYVSAKNAFIIESMVELAKWPQDPRRLFRTTRYRINSKSLYDNFNLSYAIAKHDRGKYRAMSEEAAAGLGMHCSEEVISEKLQRFLNTMGYRLDPEMERDWDQFLGDRGAL